jgi:hypothetical protein
MTETTSAGGASDDPPGDGEAQAEAQVPPIDAQHLGTAVLPCWNGLPLQAQVRSIAQADDVIGTRPIPNARNEIVKWLLRHTKM